MKNVLTIAIVFVVVILSGWLLTRFESHHLKRATAQTRDTMIFLNTMTDTITPFVEAAGYKIPEDVTIQPNSQSYTLGKRQINLCLLTPTGMKPKEETLYFVLAHELAHVLNQKIGHGREFKQIFENILIQMDAGLPGFSRHAIRSRNSLVWC